MTQITADTPACEVWRTACDEWDLTTGQHASNQAATAILEQAFAARDAAKDARIAELEAREKALLDENEKLREAVRDLFSRAGAHIGAAAMREHSAALQSGESQALNQGDRP